MTRYIGNEPKYHNSNKKHWKISNRNFTFWFFWTRGSENCRWNSIKCIKFLRKSLLANVGVDPHDIRVISKTLNPTGLTGRSVDMLNMIMVYTSKIFLTYKFFSILDFSLFPASQFPFALILFKLRKLDSWKK